MTTWRPISAIAAAAVILGVVAVARAQQPPAQAAGGAQDHVAALKQSIQQGLKLARQYEWVETTIISLKGEEKARKQNRCYYGADGKVQKVSLDQAAAPSQDAGRQRRSQGRRPGQAAGGREQEGRHTGLHEAGGGPDSLSTCRRRRRASRRRRMPAG